MVENKSTIFVNCILIFPPLFPLLSLCPVELSQQVSKLLPKIGNIVADDVPVSNDEEKDNQVVSTFGPTPTGEKYMHHHEVCVSCSTDSPRAYTWRLRTSCPTTYQTLELAHHL